jgi:hypothetical protein
MSHLAETDHKQIVLFTLDAPRSIVRVVSLISGAK